VSKILLTNLVILKMLLIQQDVVQENPDLPKKSLDGFGMIDIDGEKKLVVLGVKTSEDKSTTPI